MTQSLTRFARQSGRRPSLSTARRLASLLAGLALEVLAGLALALGALRLLLALTRSAPQSGLRPSLLVPAPGDETDPGDTDPGDTDPGDTDPAAAALAWAEARYAEIRADRLPSLPIDPAGELARLAGFRVVELRARARHQLGADARVNGRRIAQARKADLLTALAAV